MGNAGFDAGTFAPEVIVLKNFTNCNKPLLIGSLSLLVSL